MEDSKAQTSAEVEKGLLEKAQDPVFLRLSLK
jgi:hypothetical protein